MASGRGLAETLRKGAGIAFRIFPTCPDPRFRGAQKGPDSPRPCGAVTLVAEWTPPTVEDRTLSDKILCH